MCLALGKLQLKDVFWHSFPDLLPSCDSVPSMQAKYWALGNGTHAVDPGLFQGSLCGHQVLLVGVIGLILRLASWPC